MRQQQLESTRVGGGWGLDLEEETWCTGKRRGVVYLIAMLQKGQSVFRNRK